MGKGGAGVSRSIPVRCWVTETLAHGHGLVTVAIHGGEDVICEVINSLIMDIMFDFKEAGGGGIGGVDGGVPDVLGILD